MLPESASSTLSAIVLYGCQHVLIITSFQVCPFDVSIAYNMLLVGLIGAAMHIVVFGLTKMFLYKHEQEDNVKLVKYASTFSNCALMGAPFLQSLFLDASMQAEVLI